MTTIRFNIEIIRKALVIIGVLILSQLLSCGPGSSNGKRGFEALIAEQLGIANFRKAHDSSFATVDLITGDSLRINPGYNLIDDPLSRRKLRALAKINNGQIERLEVIDTLFDVRKIVREQWVIENNGGQLNFIVTDFNGRSLHRLGQNFIPAQRIWNYNETTVDSLGNSSTEWGVIGARAATRRKKVE